MSGIKEKALLLHYSCSQDIGKCIRCLRIGWSTILGSPKFFITKFLLQQPRACSRGALICPTGPTCQLPSPVSGIPVTAPTAFKTPYHFSEAPFTVTCLTSGQKSKLPQPAVRDAYLGTLWGCPAVTTLLECGEQSLSCLQHIPEANLWGQTCPHHLSWTGRSLFSLPLCLLRFYRGMQISGCTSEVHIAFAGTCEGVPTHFRKRTDCTGIVLNFSVGEGCCFSWETYGTPRWIPSQQWRQVLNVQ